MEVRKDIEQCTHLYAVCTCTSVALAYPPRVMGTENCSRNTGSVPSFPGNTKSKSDHNSRRLFCMGDPERMRRWGVVTCKGGGGCCHSNDSWNNNFVCLLFWHLFTGEGDLCIGVADLVSLIQHHVVPLVTQQQVLAQPDGSVCRHQHTITFTCTAML